MVRPRGELTSGTRRLARGLVGAALAEIAPALPSLLPRQRPIVLPALCGVSAAPQIALTFDDGPDPDGTPAILDTLAAHRATATFFLLGGHIREHADVVARILAEGHDLGIHGWDHWPTLGKSPQRLHRELERTLAVIDDSFGVRPRWYRPPFGVLTATSLAAASRLGLRTVLWSTWGGDWARGASVDSVVRRIVRDARPGGTALLHDSDRASARNSWQVTRGATEVLLQRWAADGLPVGSLATHELRPLRSAQPARRYAVRSR